MQKRLAFLLSLAASILLSSLTPVMADVTNSTSVTITVEEKEKKPRKVTDSFWSVSLLGGLGFFQNAKHYRTYRMNMYDIEWHNYASHFGIDPTGEISLEVSYQQRINQTNFYWGTRASGGVMVDMHDAGMHIDVAPTISYMRHPGGFYNSFEVKLGLGLGYRSKPEGSFAFTPQLDAMYWFNHLGLGGYVKYSIAKSVEWPNDVEKSFYNPGTNTHWTDYVTEWVPVPGWQFGVGARVALRF